MHKVSIIVPFINGEKYIKKCLDNLINIKYSDYEIILIDDSSIDNSKKSIEEFVKNVEDKLDKNNLKIKYYYLEDNTIGVGKARNYGIEKANGKYLMFVDVDDYIDEDLLVTLEKYMQLDIDLIKYKMEIIEEENIKEIKGQKKKSKNKKETDGPIFDIITGEEAFNKLCFNDKYFDSPCLYLIKKEYIEKNNFIFPENMYHEDFGLLPILIASANKVISTKENGYYYVQTNNSIMRNNSYEKTLTKMNNKIKHYINMIKVIEKTNLSIKTKTNMKTYYTNSILKDLKSIKKEEKAIFKEKIKKLQLIDNLKEDNIKQIIKKVFLKVWINY